MNSILEKRKLPEAPKTTRDYTEKPYSRKNVDELKKNIVTKLQME
jgi:hypothetical protein